MNNIRTLLTKQFYNSCLYKLCLALLFSLVTITAMANQVDDRQIVKLSEVQRNHLLVNMRGLLTTTQNILAALAKEDMNTVSEKAKAVGFNMKSKRPNPLHDVLPKEFRQLGMSMHKEFDLIATEAMSLNDAKYTLQQLSATMSKCTACHSAYQIRVR